MARSSTVANRSPWGSAGSLCGRLGPPRWSTRPRPSKKRIAQSGLLLWDQAVQQGAGVAAGCDRLGLADADPDLLHLPGLRFGRVCAGSTPGDRRDAEPPGPAGRLLDWGPDGL